MRTDDLIDTLGRDLRPAPPSVAPKRLAWAAGGGAAAALAAVVFWLGLRPDLAAAASTPAFWLKAGYALVLGAAGFLAVERLARPAGSGRAGFVVAAAAVAMVVALGAAQLAIAAPGARLPLWLGHSWDRCAVNILALSLPMLAATLLVLRSLAPTRLALAGAAAGLFCGGVAAAAYGLSCVETAPAFVATWYSLGIALPSILGGFVGPWVLRWR